MQVAASDLQKQGLEIDPANNQIVKRTADPGINDLGVKAKRELAEAIAFTKKPPIHLFRAGKLLHQAIAEKCQMDQGRCS